MFCYTCNTNLYSEDELKCTECKHSSHYNCVGQTGANFRNINKLKYSCPSCKQKSASPDHKPKSTDEKQIQQVQPGAKQQQLGSQTDRDFFEEKFRAMETLIQKNKEEIIKSLEELVKGLENKLLEKEKIIEQMEERIDMMENKDRNQNIEIGNFPETKGENYIGCVQEIGNKIGIVINPGDIQVAHRVNSRTQSTRPIIAQLGSRFQRNQWLMKYKEYKKKNDNKLKAKKINGNLPDTMIYLQEHITVKRKILLKKIKDHAKIQHFKYVWVHEGAIFMKKGDDDNKSFKFYSERDWENYKTKNGF
ncbi:hypothetical protein WDU94_013861 [Cyamophila willieti]